MKKLVLGTTALVLLLQGCNNSAPQFVQMNDQVAQVSAKSSSNHHPDFIRKMKDPANYKFATNRTISSICGNNDLQHVASYDGTLGQTVEYVQKHEKAVGAMATGNSDSSRKFCSGTLIGEDLFLTASHCIDSSVTKDKYIAMNFQRQKGSSNLEKQDHYKVVEVVEDGNNGLDYAVLKLDGKPGAKYGWTKIKAVLPAAEEQLTIIQHPKGQPKQIEAGQMVGGLSGAYMSYKDLDTEPGSSGSGVLNDEGLVVGVHTNGGCFSSGGANKGVAMTEIFKASKVLPGLSNSRKISRR